MYRKEPSAIIYDEHSRECTMFHFGIYRHSNLKRIGSRTPANNHPRVVRPAAALFAHTAPASAVTNPEPKMKPDRNQNKKSPPQTDKSSSQLPIGLARATSQLDRNAWQRVATYMTNSGSKQTWGRIFSVRNHIEKRQTDRTNCPGPAFTLLSSYGAGQHN